ncbi:MAG: hypothetical protein QM831_02100 [Kofleriaceae bacterium]
MQTIDLETLETVCGGESFSEVARAVRANPDVSVGETYAQTTSFIANHPFFHEGVMNAPIGFGKHFRNVPFVGPGRVLKGALTGNGTEIQKGIQVTRATWDAA